MRIRYSDHLISLLAILQIVEFHLIAVLMVRISFELLAFEEMASKKCYVILLKPLKDTLREQIRVIKPLCVLLRYSAAS
jgi:hypothetical protein